MLVSSFLETITVNYCVYFLTCGSDYIDSLLYTHVYTADKLTFRNIYCTVNYCAYFLTSGSTVGQLENVINFSLPFPGIVGSH
jgi:hypothetical protein